MAQNFFFRTSAPILPADTSTLNSSTSLNERDPLQPWIEKYRPNSMEEISSQTQVVKVLKTTIESQNLPHLLFYGPPGTGKTSTILALAKTLFGPSLYKARVLELNASDERGIDVIREKVKNFARATAKSTTDQSHRSIPPYKLIILDEADSMTSDAQSALRRTMETYSKTTRFCLICNYVTRIIEPIASRCAKFRFTPLPSEAIEERIQYIASQESLTLDTDALSTLQFISEGDLRKAIMYLQSASKLSNTIPSSTLLDISGTVPALEIQTLLNYWLTPAPFPSVPLMVTHLQSMLHEAYPMDRLLHALYESMIQELTLSSNVKAKLALLFAKVDLQLHQGADAFLQLTDLVLEGCRICQASKAA